MVPVPPIHPPRARHGRIHTKCAVRNLD
jgi:hypothetical protein